MGTGPPPEEYTQVQCTALEGELREAVKGPDATWLANCKEGAPFVVGEGTSNDPGALAQQQAIEGVKSSGRLSDLVGASDYLSSHVLARMAQDEDLTLERILLDATANAGPALAEEAGKQLDRLGAADGRAGALSRPDATIAPVQWDPAAERGAGSVAVQGVEWAYLDYQDELCPEEDLRTRLGLEAGSNESRQCLVLHIAAGLLWRTAAPPSAGDVRDLARALRQELWDRAADAVAALGDPPPSVSPREAEIRMHAHDAMHAHHDKDFRCLVVFPLDALARVTVHVWRVNHWGQLEIDSILPRASSESEMHVLIHRGHMRVLREPDPGAGAALIRHWAFEEKPLREQVAHGWERHLESEAAEGPVVCGRTYPCQHCKRAQDAERGQGTERSGGQAASGVFAPGNALGEESALGSALQSSEVPPPSLKALPLLGGSARRRSSLVPATGPLR